MAKGVEDQPLPLNPDGSPDLSRVTVENIQLFGIPEDQAEDLARMHEPVRQSLSLNTRKSRRHLIFYLPIAAIGGALLREKADQSLDRAAANLAGIEDSKGQGEIRKMALTEATETPERPTFVEFDTNVETPIPYTSHGWGFVVKAEDIKKYGKTLQDNKGWKLIFTHRRIDENGYITGTVKQTSSEISVDQNGRIEDPPTNVKRRQIVVPDGQIYDSYLFESFDARPLQTFMTITRTTSDRPIEENYPVQLESGDEYIRSLKKLPFVVSEKEPKYGVGLASLANQGEFINKLSPQTNINTIAIVDSTWLEANDLPRLISDMDTVKIVFIPSEIAEMDWNGPDIEHPAQVRLTYETIPYILERGRVGEEIEDRHTAFSNTMKSIDRFCKENELDQYGAGWSLPFGDILNIRANDYDYFYKTFHGTPETRSEYFSEAIMFLRNFLPVLRHRHRTFEESYDALEEGHKNVIDEALFLAMRAVGNSPKMNYAEVVGDVFPAFKDIAEKRAEIFQVFEEKYADDIPDDLWSYL